MEVWLANLIEGLEHSTPQGREEAASLRKMDDDLEALDFERTALRAERDDLIAALHVALKYLPAACPALPVIDAAIAKAEAR